MTDPKPLAVVTGGRRGIGLAVARALAVKGFDLAITGVSADPAAEEAIEALRSLGGAVEFLVSDLSDVSVHRRTIDRIVERFGRLDCLVNNAGIASPARGDFLDMLPENFDTVLGTNLRGTVFFTQAAVRAMLSIDSGGHPRSVINITSVSAELASPERLDYCMSKAGMAMFTRGLALRLAETGISVFEVRPGIIRSDMTAAVSGKYDRLIEEGGVPMRRWGEGSDVAGAVVALASGAFGFATGSIVNTDGGLSVARF